MLPLAALPPLAIRMRPRLMRPRRPGPARAVRLPPMGLRLAVLRSRPVRNLGKTALPLSRECRFHASGYRRRSISMSSDVKPVRIKLFGPGRAWVWDDVSRGYALEDGLGTWHRIQ